MLGTSKAINQKKFGEINVRLLIFTRNCAKSIPSLTDIHKKEYAVLLGGNPPNQSSVNPSL